MTLEIPPDADSDPTLPDGIVPWSDEETRWLQAHLSIVGHDEPVPTWLERLYNRLFRRST